MRRLSGKLGALAALAVAAPLAAMAQQAPTGVATDPPGSDRAGKTSRADAPPPDPTPAAGTRLGRDVTAPVPAATARPADADAAARGAAPAVRGATPPPVIGSHQIDRYDALDKEQRAVQANPKSLADWIILGEIAHEIAMDAPADQAGKYFQISSDAFQNALAQDPNNAGLQAAVQFAKDQQANVENFERSRDTYTDTYLNARRRDLAATGNTPAVLMYEPPTPSRTLPGPAPAPASLAPAASASGSTRPAPATPADAAATVRATTDPAVDSATPLVKEGNTPVAEASPAVFPARTNAPATDAANYGTQANYSAGSTAPTYPAPRYRTFAGPGATPYTYQQYSNSYFPAGIYDNPAVQPMTVQRYATQVVPNAFEQQILNRATTPRVR